jgi:hypothetical protein
MVIFADEAIAYVERANVTACVVRREMTVARLRRLRREAERLHARWGDARVSVTVVESTAIGEVQADVRQETAGLLRDFPAVLMVTVIEGGGLRAVAARAILSAMSLVAKRRGVKVFDDVAAAMAWIAPRLPSVAGVTAPSARELVELVAEARRAIGAPQSAVG